MKAATFLSVPCHHIKEYRYVHGAVEPIGGKGCFLIIGGISEEKNSKNKMLQINCEVLYITL